MNTVDDPTIQKKQDTGNSCPLISRNTRMRIRRISKIKIRENHFLTQLLVSRRFHNIHRQLITPTIESEDEIQGQSCNLLNVCPRNIAHPQRFYEYGLGGNHSHDMIDRSPLGTCFFLSNTLWLIVLYDYFNFFESEDALNATVEIGSLNVPFIAYRS